jgi:hypothetical protein
MSTLCFRMQIANSTRTKALVATFVVLVASNGSALAWGYEGHPIIAEIAEQFLEPEPAHRVRDLLAIENRTTLAEVSTWADEIRPQHPETRRWHFVNIPIYPTAGEPSAYDAARDRPQHECVVAKIEDFERVLADPQASERQRLGALKYVVHFIGDIHQPLRTPVIAWRRGSIPEIVDRGVTGFIVENETEAVQAVGALDRLDRRNIRRVFEQRFTVQRMAQEYMH